MQNVVYGDYIKIVSVMLSPMCLSTICEITQKVWTDFWGTIFWNGALVTWLDFDGDLEFFSYTFCGSMLY